MSPINILLLLKFAPSISAASNLVQSGNIIINGSLVSNKYFGLRPGDIIQINRKFFQYNKLLYKYHT
jgi:ribosomal protein S4